MHGNGLADEHLLARLQSGDGRALGELYRRYRVRLYGYCFRLLRSSDDAEDAVHETFLKLRTGANSLNHAGAFRTWLYHVARNESLMMLRRTHGRSTPIPAEIPDILTPLESLVSKDNAELVRTAIGRLKAEYHEVLILREYEGFSYAEIAEVTETTLDSVKARIFKARKALAAHLEHLFKERKES